VSASEEEWEPDSATVNAVAEASPEWRHGRVRVRSATRIGAGYGLSGGQVVRVRADSERGGSFSFVLKREGAQAIGRALKFHRAVGSQVTGSVPACLGGLVHEASDTGVILSPAHDLPAVPPVASALLHKCSITPRRAPPAGARSRGGGASSAREGSSPAAGRLRGTPFGRLAGESFVDRNAPTMRLCSSGGTRTKLRFRGLRKSCVVAYVATGSRSRRGARKSAEIVPRLSVHPRPSVTSLEQCDVVARSCRSSARRSRAVWKRSGRW
jgi:hypothetical protein